MTADNHVDAGCFPRDALVHAEARMAEHDDLVDALLRQAVDLGLHRFDRVGEDDVVTGAGEFMGVLRGQADQPDLFAVLFDHRRFADRIRQQRLTGNIGVRHQDGEFNRIHKPLQHFGAVVEFVVPHGHRVITHLVHHFGSQRTLVVGVEERALKLVAPVHQQRIVGPAPRFVDSRHQPARAAKAFAGAVVLGGTGAIILADRLEPRVEVIGVQDGQFVLGGCHSAGHGQRGGARQESFHRSSPVVL